MFSIMGNCPTYLKVYVRREYLHNNTKGHGDFIEAIAYAVRCKPASSLWFQCALGPPYGGAHYLLPITALCWQHCEPPADMTYVQPWDVFSSEFGIVELDFIRNGAAFILPDRRPAQYKWTIDFINSPLADDMEQHKHLHVAFIEGGLIGAFPNNRILLPDRAFWPMVEPDFKWDLASWAYDERSEGNEYLFKPAIKIADPVDAG